MSGAVSATEVLATVGGFPVELLDVDFGGRMALTATNDVVDETVVHVPEIAGFEEVVEDAGVDGGVGG